MSRNFPASVGWMSVPPTLIQLLRAEALRVAQKVDQDQGDQK